MTFLTRSFRQLIKLSEFAFLLLRMWWGYQLKGGRDWSTHRRALWLQRSCRRILEIMRFEVEVVGEPPQGSFIASNHLSYMDILVMASITPQIFLSKRSVADWPIIGGLVRKSGTLFIDRSRRSDVMNKEEEFAKVIDSKVGMTVFLEGTSTDGSLVLPFKSSLLEPATRNQWPVVPAYLKYECEGGDASVDVCWWGDMTFGDHLLKMMTLESVRATIVFGEPLSPGSDRKELARSLHGKVVELKSKLERVNFETNRLGPALESGVETKRL